MQHSNPQIKRPNEAMAKAAHEKWKVANDVYLAETATDRELVDLYNKGNIFGRPDYALVQEASRRIDAAERKLSDETRDEKEILNAWKPVRDAGNALIEGSESRGTRYAEATLDNYVAKSPEQNEIVQSLRDYAEQSTELVPKGKNVILLGPKGTGKDHLLMGLAKEVLRFSGFTTKWENGCDIRERSRISATGSSGQRSFRVSDSEPDILWISDPLLPSGVLSDFQQDAMFSVIDRRYSNLKPTWITINVADGEEAERRMGSQTVDRLRHDALILFCNWPSFRQSK